MRKQQACRSSSFLDWSFDVQFGPSGSNLYLYERSEAETDRLRFVIGESSDLFKWNEQKRAGRRVVCEWNDLRCSVAGRYRPNGSVV